MLREHFDESKNVLKDRLNRRVVFSREKMTDFLGRVTVLQVLPDESANLASPIVVASL
jgi:hypothetical protein